LPDSQFLDPALKSLVTWTDLFNGKDDGLASTCQTDPVTHSLRILHTGQAHHVLHVGYDGQMKALCRIKSFPEIRKDCTSFMAPLCAYQCNAPPLPYRARAGQGWGFEV